MNFKLFVFVLLFGFSFGQKICIIGSGMGATSTVKFLRDMNPSLELHVFEKRTRVGGRVLTLELGDPVITLNAGASIMHKENHYLASLAEELDLKMEELPPVSSGIYDGKEFIFESSGVEMVDMGKMFWKYGKNLYTMQNIINEVKINFEKLYVQQESGVSYTTPDDLLKDNDLYDLTQISLREAMEGRGIGTKLIDELMTTVNRVNYGQDCSLSGLAGMIGLIGSGHELRTVKGGFQQICGKMLESKKAHIHLNTTVMEVRKEATDGFILKLETGEEKCDAVVIAAPLEQSDLKLPGSTPLVQQRPYQLTQTTFIQGALKASFFGKRSKAPGNIYTIEKPEVEFNSIGCYSSQQGNDSLYKIFSRKPLTDEFVDRLFDQPKILKVIPWRAYPVFTPPEKFTPFVLEKNLVYLNTLESAASAMEISAIAAKNAALLLDQWMNLDKSKPKMETDEKQIEL